MHCQVSSCDDKADYFYVCRSPSKGTFFACRCNIHALHLVKATLDFSWDPTDFQSWKDLMKVSQVMES